MLYNGNRPNQVHIGKLFNINILNMIKNLKHLFQYNFLTTAYKRKNYFVSKSFSVTVMMLNLIY
jgi:hypothetical protein